MNGTWRRRYARYLYERHLYERHLIALRLRFILRSPRLISSVLPPGCFLAPDTDASRPPGTMPPGVFS